MPAAPSIAFDDQGEVVPAVGFDFGSVDARLDGERGERAGDAAAVRRETFARLLHLLTHGADGEEAGRRAHLLAYLAGQSPCENQDELARLLGVSAGRVSQLLNITKRELSKRACAE